LPRNVSLFRPIWDRWQALAQQRLEHGMEYVDAVNPRAVRAASALPALLGARTLSLLRESGPFPASGRKVKVPRGEVRSTMARLAITLASRSSLQSMFGRHATGR
jgi:farnesyl-diphosphate farnesyltransferase